jgi:sugar/nucleoside kinase (ribokinase family)
MLYGLHEQWPIVECLELGHACAAASMRAVSTTAGVGTVAECLALAKQWGFRPLEL